MVNKDKVFVIGFQKTGITSLKEALKVLGYRVHGGDQQLMRFKDKTALHDNIRAKLLSWDALQDMPWPLFYQDLFVLYHEAKFLLTLRNTDKWIRSVVRYFASIRVPLQEKIYGEPKRRLKS